MNRTKPEAVDQSATRAGWIIEHYNVYSEPGKSHLTRFVDRTSVAKYLIDTQDTIRSLLDPTATTARLNEHTPHSTSRIPRWTRNQLTDLAVHVPQPREGSRSRLSKDAGTIKVMVTSKDRPLTSWLTARNTPPAAWVNAEDTSTDRRMANSVAGHLTSRTWAHAKKGRRTTRELDELHGKYGVFQVTASPGNNPRCNHTKGQVDQGTRSKDESKSGEPTSLNLLQIRNTERYRLLEQQTNKDRGTQHAFNEGTDRASHTSGTGHPRLSYSTAVPKYQPTCLQRS